MSSVFTLIVLELGVLLVPVVLLREAEGLSRCLAQQKALSGSSEPLSKTGQANVDLESSVREVGTKGSLGLPGQTM